MAFAEQLAEVGIRLGVKSGFRKRSPLHRLAAFVVIDGDTAEVRAISFPTAANRALTVVSNLGICVRIAAAHLALFREFGVKYLFSGHYHSNAVAHDGDLEAVTTGPVGQLQGGDKSGLRVIIVRDSGLEHRYYHFGELPTRIDLAPAKPSAAN